MTDNAVFTDALRQRLQLALGPIAELGDEIPGVGSRTFGATTRADRVEAIATVHPPLPEGPDPDLLRQRIDGLRELGHGLIDLPLATGNLAGQTWVLESRSSLPSARERLSAGLLPLAHGISATRDLSRALAAMHRRGITHGNVTVDTVRITGDGARLGGAVAASATVRGDLDGLGEVAWSLLSGEVNHRTSRRLSQIRRGIAPSLDALCAALNAADSRDRPQRAEVVLDALDAVRTRRSNPFASIVDVGIRDGRPRRAVALAVVGAALLLLFALLESRA